VRHPFLSKKKKKKIITDVVIVPALKKHFYHGLEGRDESGSLKIQPNLTDQIPKGG
jgi:hypothetical protein